MGIKWILLDLMWPLTASLLFMPPHHSEFMGPRLPRSVEEALWHDFYFFSAHLHELGSLQYALHPWPLAQDLVNTLTPTPIASLAHHALTFLSGFLGGFPFVYFIGSPPPLAIFSDGKGLAPSSSLVQLA